MSRNSRRSLAPILSISLLTGLAMAPDGSAAERAGKGAAPPDVAAAVAADRQALADSLESRERRLAGRDRREVLVEVTERIAQLGLVPAPDAADLADLLFERAQLEIERDRCAVAADPSDCVATGRSLAAVEARFLDRAGVTAEDFKSGRSLAGAVPVAARGDAPAPIINCDATSNLAPCWPDDPPDPVPHPYCRCDVYVTSLSRWMAPWWALECNNHGGHGVCSNNVDSAHGTGCGAMTGWVAIWKGSGHVGTRNCPDDHFTCFRGPSRCDNGGSWGNVCSCDTWHSQLWDAGGEFYGGRLDDTVPVFQLYVPGLEYAGTCGQSTLSAVNFVTENDPWCCDDPMGTLVANRATAPGWTSVDVPAAAQNCEGGSRSGVYPYCGTFGATYRIESNCQNIVRYF